MSLPYLGNPPSAHPLTDIAANIRNIVNPNWENQLEMQRRMMADPSLVSQLAEVERNAPGTIAKMGFGKKLTSIIQNTPETLQQKSAKELRDLQIQDAKNGIEEFGMKKKKFQDEQVDREKSLKGIDAFKKFDIRKESENFVNGKPSNDFLKALSESGNENQQVFMAYANNLSGIRRLSQEHELALMRINKEDRLAQARDDKSYQRMLNSNAVDSYQKTNVGSTAAWRDILDIGSGGADKATKFAQNPTLVKTDRDRELMQIGQYIQSNKQAGIEMQKRASLGEARKEMAAAQMKGLKPEEVAMHVQAMNEHYNNINRLDPTFNIRAAQKGREVRLIDENTGVPIDDESSAVDVNSLPIPKNVPPRKFFDDAVESYNNAPHTIIGGDKMTKTRFLYEFKKRYGDEAYNLLKKRI
jgi:hypothetical protein